MRVLRSAFDLLRFTVEGGVSVVSPSMMFTDVAMAECAKGMKRLLLLSHLALPAFASSPFGSGRSRFIGWLRACASCIPFCVYLILSSKSS